MSVNNFLFGIDIDQFPKWKWWGEDHHIDVSWNESWIGTDQKRYYKFYENYLVLIMPSFIDPREGRTTIALKWKKIH